MSDEAVILKDVPPDERFDAIVALTLVAPPGAPEAPGQFFYNRNTKTIYMPNSAGTGFDSFPLAPLEGDGVALATLADVDGEELTYDKGALLVGDGAGKFTEFLVVSDGQVIVKKTSEAKGFEARDYTFAGLLDVNMSTPPTEGQVPKWNDSANKWEPGDDNEGEGGDPGVEITVRSLDGGDTATASVLEFPEFWHTDEGGGVVSIKPPVSQAYLFNDCIDPSLGFIVWDNIPEDACDLFDIVTGDDTRMTNSSGATRKYLVMHGGAIELTAAGAPGSDTFVFPSGIEFVKNASTVIGRYDLFTLFPIGYASLPPMSYFFALIISLDDTEYLRVRYVGSGIDPTWLGGGTNNRRTWLKAILIDG
jgi:hypothetical protein